MTAQYPVPSAAHLKVRTWMYGFGTEHRIEPTHPQKIATEVRRTRTGINS
jgi:hypothetical protein